MDLNVSKIFVKLSRIITNVLMLVLFVLSARYGQHQNLARLNNLRVSSTGLRYLGAARCGTMAKEEDLK